MDIHFFDNWHQPMGVFTFVLAIILIGSLFSWLKTKSQQETIREAIKAGVDLNPEMLKNLETDGGKGGLGLAGMILLAVSAAMVFFGYQLAQLDGDDEVFTIFIGLAAFPFLIGLVFTIVTLVRRAGGSDSK